MADRMRVLTENEVALLPRWVAVAFAIRCARRVQPVFQADWPDAPARYGEDIEHAIGYAERLLRGEEGACAGAAEAVLTVTHKARPNYSWAAASAAYNAYAAAIVAEPTAVYVHAAAAAASGAMCSTAPSEPMRESIRRDFDALKAMSERERWDDKTRPALGFLGPLWMEGEEPDWVGLARKGRRSDGRQEAEGAGRQD